MLCHPSEFVFTGTDIGTNKDCTVTIPFTDDSNSTISRLIFDFTAEEYLVKSFNSDTNEVQVFDDGKETMVEVPQYEQLPSLAEEIERMLEDGG